MSSQEQVVCVVEDNKAIRKLFCTLLNKAGINTIDFGEGEPALEWLKNNKPIALIVDILLPGNKSGTEILAAFKQFPGTEKIPTIAVTGFAQGNDREKFLEMGFDSYIPKPINTASFGNDIREVIAQKSK